MRNEGSPRLESSGHDRKPARIVLQTGEEFDVAHHFVHKSGNLVCAYETYRDGGIDYRFSVHAVAYIDTTSDEYERVEDPSDAPSTVMMAGATPPEFEDDDCDGEEDCELVTDGGFDRTANTVYGVDDDEVTIKYATPVWFETSPPVDAGRPLPEDGDDDGEDDREFVADDIPPCTCGADLLETAELDTVLAPRAGAREPSPAMRPVPEAECSECGMTVGAAHGLGVVLAVWESRGESLPGDCRGDDQ